MLSKMKNKLRPYIWGFQVYWRESTWLDKCGFVIGTCMYILLLLVALFSLVIAGYGFYHQSGTAMFGGAISAAVFTCVCFLPYQYYQYIKTKKMQSSTGQAIQRGLISGLGVFLEVFSIIDDVERMDAAYQIFKKNGDIKTLEWNDLCFYSDHAIEDRAFWDKVDALLDDEHPKHTEWTLMAGCPNIDDDAAIYAIVQQWWDTRHDESIVDNAKECDIYM